MCIRDRLKGNKVQFEDIQGKDENCHIANHFGKTASNCEMVNPNGIATTHNQIQQLTNETQNTETTNPGTCHVPFWKPLSRSRTAPDLMSSSINLASTKNQNCEKILHKTKEQTKVTIDCTIFLCINQC